MIRFEVYTDKAGEYRWRIRANNHEIICTSGEGYKNRQDCLDTINIIRSMANEAKIDIIRSQDLMNE